MKKLLIYGCGYPSITSLIEYLNTRTKEWDIVGYLDDSKFGKINDYMRYPVLGDENAIQEFIEKGYYFFNNVSSTPDNMEKVARKLNKYQAKLCTLIFPEPPDIDLNTVTVGEGSIISPQVIVGAGATIGENVIVKQQAIVSHGCDIGNYCIIGPNAGIMGNVKIGSKTFIGAKAIVRDEISIGKNCVVGMGAVVTKSIPDNTTVVGNPAHPI